MTRFERPPAHSCTSANHRRRCEHQPIMDAGTVWRVTSQETKVAANNKWSINTYTIHKHNIVRHNVTP